MTPTEAPALRLPPRRFVRAAWAIHRGIYALTGGRFGLWQPEGGRRFGTLRIETLGRRSGQPRTSILGYFTEGESLVTLAMNGWATSDPAWWLNLQARPEASVSLAGSKRQVRARAAVGPERDRLWARFRDYPGWGDDLDALAARRGTETAVVVLEPALASLIGAQP